ncbi:hypothetical protein LSAT2_019348 [Lamellibrachia satsuma]|nr:hypothetical protein LSAT2_019348 [Lamellibrachia satsuma]
MRGASRRVKLAAASVFGSLLVYLCSISVSVSRVPTVSVCDPALWQERRLRLLNAYPTYNSHQHEDCDVGRIMSKLYTFSDLARFTQCQRVFYNRVPKCGSRTVLSTFKILARALHYKVESVERYGRSSYISNVSLMVSQLHRQRLIDGESVTSATSH